eukprot:1895968-Rhodomonas_salina.5
MGSWGGCYLIVDDGRALAQYLRGSIPPVLKPPGTIHPCQQVVTQQDTEDVESCCRFRGQAFDMGGFVGPGDCSMLVCILMPSISVQKNGSASAVSPPGGTIRFVSTGHRTRCSHNKLTDLVGFARGRS